MKIYIGYSKFENHLQIVDDVDVLSPEITTFHELEVSDDVTVSIYIGEIAQRNIEFDFEDHTNPKDR